MTGNRRAARVDGTREHGGEWRVVAGTRQVSLVGHAERPLYSTCSGKPGVGGLSTGVKVSERQWDLRGWGWDLRLPDAQRLLPTPSKLMGSSDGGKDKGRM